MKLEKDILLGKTVFHIKNTVPNISRSERIAVKKQIAAELCQVLCRKGVILN